MDINEFIVRYFPDYSTSELIKETNDLDLLMHENFDEGSSADILLKTKYKNNTWNNDLENDFHNNMMEIYKQSIEGYLKTL